MSRMADSFIGQLEIHGFKARVISIEHMEEIQSEIEGIKNTHKDVHENIGRYLSGFKYKPSEDSFEAESIIVIAIPQPIARIHFTLDKKKHSVIMPPTYAYNASRELEENQKNIAGVTNILNKILAAKGYKATKVNLPCKLLAVRSGLGSYGRNNICYIDNESSFYWLGVYLTDMPCESDSWQESTIMDKCKDCNLCLHNCPTGAIDNDRFIIHANKCITLQNESEKAFPEWLNPKWHNSIIGCMRCQTVCPANRDYIKNIDDIAEFDEMETRRILEKTPLRELPESTYRKLELINFIDEYNLLARNLKALIGN